MIPPYGDIVSVVVSRPGLPPSDFPGHGGVNDGAVGGVGGNVNGVGCKDGLADAGNAGNVNILAYICEYCHYAPICADAHRKILAHGHPELVVLVVLVVLVLLLLVDDEIPGLVLSVCLGLGVPHSLVGLSSSPFVIG